MDQESPLRKGEKAEKLPQEQFYENQLIPGGFVTGQGLQPPPRTALSFQHFFPVAGRVSSSLQPDGEFGKLDPCGHLTDTKLLFY